MEVIEMRGAWNKGKLVGQKPPLKPKDIWAIRIHLQNAQAVRDLTMFNFGYRQQASRLRSRQPSSTRRRAREPDSSASHGDPAENAAVGAVRADGTNENGCWHLVGGGLASGDQYLFPSRVANSPKFRPANMRGSSIAGLKPLALIRRRTGRTRCGEPRRPSSTSAQRTCAPFSCCLLIPSWKVPSGILESRWMTRRRSPSKPKSSSAAATARATACGRFLASCPASTPGQKRPVDRPPNSLQPPIRVARCTALAMRLALWSGRLRVQTRPLARQLTHSKRLP
jgi:hypothetical protein